MKYEGYPIGYELPIFRSITKKMLTMGVPSEIAILNGTAFAMFVLVFNNLFVIVANIFIHLGARYATKIDPYFFDILKRHLHRKDFYDV